MKHLQQMLTAINFAYRQPSSILGIKKLISDYEVEDCIAWAKCLKTQTEKANNPELLPEIIAVINRGVTLVTKHTPRLTQLISLILLLDAKSHGRLEEVGTGEGKSLIAVMLAIVKVLQGKKVDIVTSSPVLACREVEEQQALFSAFAISVADNCGVGEIDLSHNGMKPCYLADVVYGDAPNFQYDILRHEYLGENTRGDRKHEVVIPDEVDSMFVDSSTALASLGFHKPAMEYLEPLFIAVWAELKRRLADGNEYSSETLIDLMTQYIVALLENKESPLLIPQHLKTFAKSQAPSWAQSAVIAQCMFKLNKHYVITKDENDCEKITPVDYQNTGVLHPNTLWDDGLHQFLQIKHGLQISAENVTASFISNVSFFQRYGKNIFGFSGTLGNRETQKLLESTYDLDIVKIPPFREKQLIEHPGILVDNEEQWLDSIIASAKEEISHGRAVLIISESIDIVTKVQNALAINNIGNIKRYSRPDTEEKKAIAEPIKPGDVIVATNLAGRGVDIKTSELVEQNGGLHVCITFLPDNERVEKQAEGRTARQGKRGSAQLIVNKSEAIQKLIDFFAVPINPTTMVELKSLRDQVDAAKLSVMKGSEIKKTIFKDKIFANFCKFIQSLKKESGYRFKLEDIEERWGFWLKEIEKTLNKQDEIPEPEILQSFENFKTAIYAEYTQNILKNPCQWIKLGNYYRSMSKFDLALDAYQRAINMDPFYAAYAYYNRACLLIFSKKENYKALALADLKAAIDSIQEHLIPQVQISLVQLGLMQHEDFNHLALVQQLQLKIDLYQQHIQNINNTINVIESYDGDIDIDEASTLSSPGSFSELIREFHNIGLEHLFTVRIVTPDDDDGFAFFRRLGVVLLGVCQIVAGVCMSVGGMFHLGKAFIDMGVADIMFAVRSMLQGTPCNWSEYRAHKIISSAIILATMGINIVKNAKIKPTQTYSRVIDQKKMLALAKEKVKSALTRGAIQESMSYGLNQLGKLAVDSQEGVIEEKVNATVSAYFQNPTNIMFLNRIFSADSVQKNDKQLNRLIKLAFELLHPKKDKFNTYGRTIIKGVLANQHPLLQATMLVDEVGSSIVEMTQLTADFCDEFFQKVGNIANELPADTLVDGTKKREILCQSIVGFITQAIKNTLQHGIVTPVTEVVLQKDIQQWTNNFQKLVQGSIQEAQPTPKELSQCYVAENKPEVSPLFTKRSAHTRVNRKSVKSLPSQLANNNQFFKSKDSALDKDKKIHENDKTLINLVAAAIADTAASQNIQNLDALGQEFIKKLGEASERLKIIRDGFSLYKAYQHSKKTKDYFEFYKESARVGGAWLGESAVKTIIVPASAAVCSPGGPLSAAACAAAAELASEAAYEVGGELGEKGAEIVKEWEENGGMASFMNKIVEFFIPSASADTITTKSTSSCHRPYFEDAKTAYDRVAGYGNFGTVGDVIGGKVQANLEKNVFRNACTLRTSYALFNAPEVQPQVDCKIPVIRSFYDNTSRNETVSGGDGLQYIFRVNTLIDFLTKVWGPPDYDGRKDNQNLQSSITEKGIAITLMPDAAPYGFTGHAEVTDGVYTGSQSVLFWKLPSKEAKTSAEYVLEETASISSSR